MFSVSETYCVFCGNEIDLECPIVKSMNLGRCCNHHSHYGSWDGSLEQYVQELTNDISVQQENQN